MHIHIQRLQGLENNLDGFIIESLLMRQIKSIELKEILILI